MSQSPVPGKESGYDHGIQQGHQTLLETTGDQLETKVYEIIQFLDMVELECVEANKDYAKESYTTTQWNDAKDSYFMTQWSTLFFLHQMLLDKHYKLFLALQQQPENMTLQQIPCDLGMPGRLQRSLWDFLTLLCSQLNQREQDQREQDPKDQRLREIYMEFHDLAYRTISTLSEIAAALKAFWEERT